MGFPWLELVELTGQELPQPAQIPDKLEDLTAQVGVEVIHRELEELARRHRLLVQ
jgi:hypothetical protein